MWESFNLLFEIKVFSSVISASHCFGKTAFHTLPSNLHCNVSDSCLEMHCCYLDDVTGRSFEIALTVDDCLSNIEAKLNAMAIRRSLLEFEMGKLKLETVNLPIDSIHELTTQNKTYKFT